MSSAESFICCDCKGITSFPSGKRGSALIEIFLWTTLFFPGIFYSMWRKTKPKRICQYCRSDFLLPANSPDIQDFLKK